MSVLSTRQQAIMHYLRAYIREVGYPPSIQEIADGVKLHSKSAVQHQLKQLEDLGYLRRDQSRPRGLVILAAPEADS
jgi:repressor LexA